MRVVSIRKKMFLSGRYSGSESRALIPDGMKFFGGVTLTLLMPTLLYCAVSGQLLPLYLIACNGALGAVLGVVMFMRSSACFLSCVPRTCVPDIPSGSSSVR